MKNAPHEASLLRAPRARKRFGQNFLRDPAVIDRIVTVIDPLPGEKVVEIGPGRGALTRPLLNASGRLDVVELDRDLIPMLQTMGTPEQRLTVHQADALKFDFRPLAPPGGKLRIVGNLPYNIATPLIFHLLTQARYIQEMHFMLQKEVAERLEIGRAHV